MKQKMTPKLMIVLMLALGVLVIFTGFAWYGWYCQEGSVPGGWCGTVREHPPWSLLAALATAPALLLTWYWRDQHKRKDIDIAQNGQVTERFTRAIEQLGSHKPPIRLGAVYALERIAKDSEKDHWVIMETLSTYIRSNSEFPVGGCRAEVLLESLKGDLQAAVTVIGRRNASFDNPEGEIDLSDVDLSKADFRRANLRKAWLVLTDFCQSSFIQADLSGAHLEHASFRDANLAKAKLTGAILLGTDFKNACLEGSDLTGATNLTEEQLRSANIYPDTRLPTEFEYLIPPSEADQTV